MVFLLEIVLFVGIVALIGMPVFSPKWRLSSGEAVIEGDYYHALLYERDEIYLTLKDLEFDFQSGKISDEDFREMDAQFKADAVKVLRAIDDYKKNPKKVLASTETSDGAQPSGETVFCVSCSSKNSKNSNFCFQCGSKLKNTG